MFCLSLVELSESCFDFIIILCATSFLPPLWPAEMVIFSFEHIGIHPVCVLISPTIGTETFFDLNLCVKLNQIRGCYNG